MFVKSHFFATSFFGCQIHFGKCYFLYCAMDVPVKEARFVVTVDDLDFWS
jgi:hypothetical protein